MHFDEEWDAQDMSCGDLVLELRSRLRKMPGKILKVIARDSGAPSDLPAWCKMTGDALVHRDPLAQSYWIKARQ